MPYPRRTTVATPTPVVGRRDLACATVDPDVFFADDPEPAQAICRTCPAAQACLAHAVTTDRTWGVWGGHTARQRRTVAKHLGLPDVPDGAVDIGIAAAMPPPPKVPRRYGPALWAAIDLYDDGTRTAKDVAALAGCGLRSVWRRRSARDSSRLADAA